MVCFLHRCHHPKLIIWIYLATDKWRDVLFNLIHNLLIDPCIMSISSSSASEIMYSYPLNFYVYILNALAQELMFSTMLISTSKGKMEIITNNKKASETLTLAMGHPYPPHCAFHPLQHDSGRFFNTHSRETWLKTSRLIVV